MEVAEENPDVLKEPPPVVRFLEFGESALLFELRPWSTTLVHRKGKLTSALNFAIHDKLKDNEIVIPFPQRDIHIRTHMNELPAVEPGPSIANRPSLDRDGVTR
jgi:small-conductance mechanosensitive channel